MIIQSSIPDLSEVSTGMFTVKFTNGEAEVTEEEAVHLMLQFPGKFSKPLITEKKKDTK